jgi:hypothetical protein
MATNSFVKVNAEILIRLIKTSFKDTFRAPYDVLYEHDHIMDSESELFYRFQKNRLFTPDVSSNHSEIVIYPMTISENVSWSPKQVLEIALTHDDIDVHNIGLMLIQTHHTDISKLISTFLGEDVFVSNAFRNAQLSCQPVSMDFIVDYISRIGGDFDDAFDRSRVIESIMVNPTLPFETLHKVYGKTSSIPYELSEFWSIYPFHTEMFMNKNPVYLRSLLEVVRSGMKATKMGIKENPRSVIPNVYNCLIELVANNPSWDPEMDSEFGSVVWSLLMDCVQILYGSSVHVDYMSFRRILLHRNPSWFLSKKLREEYDSIVTYGIFPKSLSFLSVPIKDGFMYSTCSSLLTIPTKGNFIYYYERGFVSKRTHTLEDIKWYVSIPRADSECYYSLVQNTQLFGEVGLRISRWLHKKWVIPYRRRREEMCVQIILRHSKATMVSSYGYVTKMIASFLTE